MNTIKKYIYVIIPAVLLAVTALFLKLATAGIVTVSEESAPLVFVLLPAAPLVSLIPEVTGLTKAVRSFRQTQYSVKRREIRYISLLAGTVMLTVLWLCAMVYIAFRALK
ncbi:MAG: hypothetical protein IKP75_00025 [Oscillospiraceae bacterium]|nr:hypothetical protein [Oscillospiraceae bacterium]